VLLPDHSIADPASAWDSSAFSRSLGGVPISEIGSAEVVSAEAFLCSIGPTNGSSGRTGSLEIELQVFEAHAPAEFENAFSAEGLFSGEESIDLPEWAQRALNLLSEIRGMLEGARSLAMDWAKPAFSDDITDTIRNIGKLTMIAEREMHATVLSCARARRQMLAAMPAPRSVSR
jgi:hypothetical protein